MPTLCCGNCFGDAGLTWKIQELSNNSVGTCTFCHANNVPVVNPADLREYFELVIDAYKTSTEAKAFDIQNLFRQDWGLFQSLGTKTAHSLLKAIYHGIGVPTKKYASLVGQNSEAVTRWEAFRKELKYKNRYFPKNIPDGEQLETLFYFVSSSGDLKGKSVYRARIKEGQDPYPIEEMGKPPEDVTDYGRANPFGIPYLYVASDLKTALSEVRPHVGEYICVATFKVISDLKLADLRDPRRTISPFSYNADQVKVLFKDIGYLCRLGEELSIPVVPKDALLEYLPSQYLCEFIKHHGFDGVIYKSAMAKGINYAIFDDTKLKGMRVRTYQINKIDVGFTKSSP